MKYLVVFIFFGFCILACKKTSNSSSNPGTFLYLYDLPIALNHKTTNTTISGSGAVTSDLSGNIYTWYFDSVISDAQRVAILKTDINGKKIWNFSYLSFYPAHYDLDLINNNYTWQDFVCIGQSLFLCGSDGAGVNWYILKINCSDGKIVDEISLNSLRSINNYAFLIEHMWATREGNILVGGFLGDSTGGSKPILAMYDQSGNQIWLNESIPYPVSNPANFTENPDAFVELSNGNIIYGGVGLYNFSINGNSVTSSTLYFYNINSSGKLIGIDSLAQGTYNISGNPTFYNGTGAGEIFSLFTSSSGGYIIVSTEIYDLNTDIRIKILKTDAAFHVTDSTFIGLGSSFVSSAIQNSEGDIIVSVFSQVLPVPNAVCDVYIISPNGLIIGQKSIGLPLESVYISGMCPTNDGHMVMSGLIQPANIDNNNLFILKTDNSVQY